jgi:hypothetical protein
MKTFSGNDVCDTHKLMNCQSCKIDKYFDKVDTISTFITQRLAPLGEDYEFKDQDEAAVQKYIKEKMSK